MGSDQKVALCVQHPCALLCEGVVQPGVSHCWLDVDLRSVGNKESPAMPSVPEALRRLAGQEGYELGDG